jgi:hypothetical protein
MKQAGTHWSTRPAPVPPRPASTPLRRSTLWRASSRDGIAFIGKNRYALKAFPNIVELPRPHKGE